MAAGLRPRSGSLCAAGNGVPASPHTQFWLLCMAGRGTPAPRCPRPVSRRRPRPVRRLRPRAMRHPPM
eukprot:11205222-Lingulodinium_polyedra.AAC.1